MLESFKEIIDLIDDATKIIESTASWEMKYDLIFGLKIWQKLKELDIILSWYNPDTTYQEDITAYYNALIDWKNTLGNLIP